MPVERRGGHSGRIAIVSMVALVILAAGLWLAATYMTSNPNVEVRLGDDQFQDLDADDIADDIADEGGYPLLFGDPARGTRPIWLQHLGDDPATGWTAVDAIISGCDEAVEWDHDAREFVDPCSDARYPESGEGLPQFPVTVDDGRLSVDLTPDDDEP